MTPIRVLLADDHPVVRSGIRNLLEREPDIKVIGEASDGQETLRLVQELAPDVLLLDMEMPGLKGVEVAQKLQAQESTVRILGLSAYDDRHYILNLLSSGAWGYLTKEEAPRAIVEAVRGISQGKQGWLSREVTERIVTWMQKEEPEQPQLTQRETEVLQLVVAGKTNQAIAVALGISDKTVEKHLSGVFEKLGVSSRVEAAVLAVRQELV